MAEGEQRRGAVCSQRVRWFRSGCNLASGGEGELCSTVLGLW